MKKLLTSSLDKKEKKELQEELEIISMEIKKAKAVLYKLYSSKNKGE